MDIENTQQRTWHADRLKQLIAELSKRVSSVEIF
jgi:hypothetical protein